MRLGPIIVPFALLAAPAASQERMAMFETSLASCGLMIGGLRACNLHLQANEQAAHYRQLLCRWRDPVKRQSLEARFGLATLRGQSQAARGGSCDADLVERMMQACIADLTAFNESAAAR